MSQHLRTRVVLSFVGLAAILSSFFALAVVLADAYIERQLLREILAEELEGLERRVARSGLPEGHRSFDPQGGLQGWVVAPDRLDLLPDWARSLSPGQHDVVVGDLGLEVLVSDAGGARYVVAYDETRSERVKDLLFLFLAAGVLATSYLAVWIGYATADRVIQPVHELARRVREGRYPVAGTDFGRDEIGQLAAAFDAASGRLRESLEREQQLTADLSHELRTSLAVVAGGLESLRAGAGDAKDIDRLDRMSRSLGHMQRLTEAFLLLAREPRDQRCADVIEISPIVAEAVERHREPARRRGCELVLTTATETSLVTGSSLALSVVVENLIDNAVTHGGPGDVEVTVEAHAVRVRDRGPGIPAAALGKVFERSVRAVPSPGAGLGLAIAERLCRHQGWALEVRAREAGGIEASVAWAATRAATRASAAPTP